MKMSASQIISKKRHRLARIEYLPSLLPPESRTSTRGLPTSAQQSCLAPLGFGELCRRSSTHRKVASKLHLSTSRLSAKKVQKCRLSCCTELALFYHLAPAGPSLAPTLKPIRLATPPLVEALTPHLSGPPNPEPTTIEKRSAEADQIQRFRSVQTIAQSGWKRGEEEEYTRFAVEDRESDPLALHPPRA